MAHEKFEKALQNKELRELEAELDALQELPDAPPVGVTDEQSMALLSRMHGQLVATYHEFRLQGRSSTIVGDHQSAKAQFDNAKKMLERIASLKTIAAEEGLSDAYAAMLESWREVTAKSAAVKPNGHDAREEA